MYNERKNGQNSVATNAQEERQIIKAYLIKAIDSKHFEPIDTECLSKIDAECLSNIAIGAFKSGSSKCYNIVLKADGKWLSNHYIVDTDNLINEATDFLIGQLDFWFY